MQIKRFAFPGTIFLLIIALSQAVSAQTNVSATMTVDNAFDLYISTDDTVQGTLVGSGNNWPTTYQFSQALTPGVTNYIHVAGVDAGDPAMFIGEFTLDGFDFEFANGTQTLLTNTTDWTASEVGFGGATVTVVSQGTNGVGPWGTYPLIDSAAETIWSTNLSVDNVFFSAVINPVEVAPGNTATFNVTKTFTDDRTDEVDVTLTCNGGLPLVQNFTIAGGGDGVTFVVNDIPDSGATCTVTESGGPDGYTAEMNGGEGCSWDDVTSDLYTCEIVNYPDPGMFTVNMEWVVPTEGGDAMNMDVPVTITCDAEITPSTDDDGDYWWYEVTLGDGDEATVSVDTTTGAASCWATQDLGDLSGIESTDDCDAQDVSAGEDASCTFTNTVFFEGIPTLSQYGLAILVLLTLGVGLVGFRRFA